MSVHRWASLGDIAGLRLAVNGLLDERVPRSPGRDEPRELPIDVQETADGYIVHAALPGVAPDEVEIAVLSETLRLRGAFADRGPVDGGRWILRERRFGSFDRSLTFPGPIDAAAARAAFDGGLLVIHLPKAAPERQKTIPIRVDAGD